MNFALTVADFIIILLLIIGFLKVIKQIEEVKENERQIGVDISLVSRDIKEISKDASNIRFGMK